jgi:hypothetical protein
MTSLLASLPSRFVRVALVAAVVVTAATGIRPVAAGADEEPGASAAPGAAPATSAGRWIRVDPQTGERKAGPMPGSARGAIAADPAFDTSSQGLVEEPAPGGGVMVDLGGRFRSAVTATVGPDGTPAADCVTPGAAHTEPAP